MLSFIALLSSFETVGEPLQGLGWDLQMLHLDLS